MKKIFICSMVLFLVLTSFGNTVSAASQIESNVEQLLAKLTIEEKVAQMIQADTRSIKPEQAAEYKIGSLLSGGGASPTTGNQYTDWAKRIDEYQEKVIKSCGIPLLYGVDAVHGHNNVKDATIFPHNIGLGAANNQALVEKIAQATAKEVRATGAHWAFTPTLGIPHNERWGRTYESFGDDLTRVTNLGAAYVRGLQGNLSSDISALATAKHYIGEGITKDGVNQGNVEMSEDEFHKILEEELLVPYKEAIHQGVKSVMVSYNSINGVKCHGNKELVTDILKNELGFQGIVISDYNGIDQIEGNLSYQEKAVKAVNAGLDMIMVDGFEGDTPKWLILYEGLIESVKQQDISIERINDAVRRILTAKYELDLFSNHYAKAFSIKSAQNDFGGSVHRDIARAAVKESLVLLKNERLDNDQTIMNALKDMNSIMIAGSGADNIGKQCGGWTVSWQGGLGNITSGTTIFSGINEKLKGQGKDVQYAANGFFDNDPDVAIVVVGEDPYAESNGDRSESDLNLNRRDKETIKVIQEDHPDVPIVLVLLTGRPIGISQYVQDQQIKGIVNAWFPGSEGQGVADVLFGNDDFKGTNPITWTWYPQDLTSKSDSSKVLYPVGYGLTKNQQTPSLTAPEDPSVIDLSKTNGVIKAVQFVEKDQDIRVENDSIAYLADGREVLYKVKVPSQGKGTYELSVEAATTYDRPQAFEMYMDDGKILSNQMTIRNTNDWGNFVNQTIEDKVCLDAGEHMIRFVAKTNDFNIRSFKFTKISDEYVEPERPNIQENNGTGTLIEEGAVSVTMSSSDHSQDMSWYAGNQKITHKNTVKPALDLRVTDDSLMTTIRVDESTQYQSVLGLGTSVEESTVHNIMKMDASVRRDFIKRLLDPKDGMGCTLLRLTIGTSDFTAQNFYTYYDKKTTSQPDWENGFSIQKDRDYHIIETVKEIQDVAKELGVDKDLKFFSSSWTPPGWMKLPTEASQSYKNNELLLKGGTLNNDYIDDLAKYYVRYIEEYKKEGIPIYAMTLQNEPLLEIDYPSCYITGKQEAALAKAIKSELAKSTILKDQEKDVKIWAFDHNFDGAESYVEDIRENGGFDDIDGIAYHPYGGNPSTMGKIDDMYPELTTHLTERSVWGASGANDIMSWFRNGSESYNGWVTMLDSQVGTHQWVGTPDPTMFVQNAHNPNQYWATPEVYIIGQFSKYIRPGFKRIASSYGSTNTITNVAFQDPQTKDMILIAANQTSVDQNFKVITGDVQFNATLPAGNVATYIWKADSTKIKSLDVPGSYAADRCLTYKNLQIQDDHTLQHLTPGATAEYLVNVKEAGTYQVQLEVATGRNEDNQIQIQQNDQILGSTLFKRFDWWSNNEWNQYAKVQIQVKLEKGIQRLSVVVPEGNVNIKTIAFTKGQYAYDIPGLIPATQYYSGEGVHVNNDTVEYFETYDKLRYRLQVNKSGEYDIKFKYSKDASKVAAFWVDLGTDEDSLQPQGEFFLRDSQGYEDYREETIRLTLNKGENILVITPQGADQAENYSGFNLKSISCGSYITLENQEIVEGAIDGQKIAVTLHDGTFVNTFNKDHWKLNGLPVGVDFDIERKDDQHAIVTLKNEASADFDETLSVNIVVDATEFGDTDYTISQSFDILAIDDQETLIVPPTVKYGTSEIDVTIEGGTYKTIDEYLIELTGLASRYVSIDSITYKNSKTLTLHLSWKAMYDDSPAILTVPSACYDDGQEDLEVEIMFEKTNQLPDSLIVGNQPVVLKEDLSYRSIGTLMDGQKGDYLDFYLNVQETGPYTISYDVKTDEAVTNALKISGGMGIANMNNLGSVSFGKFWGVSKGYRQSMNLQRGEQTLRFEVNTAGFKIENLKIEKQSQAITLDQSVTIKANQLIGGSPTKGWGLENKDGLFNIGCTTSGAYQDYLIHVKSTGYYTIQLKYGHQCSVTPQAIIQSVEGANINELGKIDLPSNHSWDQFVDSQKITIFLKAGQQVLRIYDEKDGFNYREMTLTKEKDTKAPIIEAQDATIQWGTDITKLDLLQLFKVKATDEVDGDLTALVDIDISQVNTNQAGTYDVVLSVNDAAKNQTTKTVQIIVKDKEPTVPDDPNNNSQTKLIDQATNIQLQTTTILDKNVQLYVKRIYDQSILKNIQQQLKHFKKQLCGLYDISLYLDNVEYMKSGEYKISIPLTDDLKTKTNIQIAHVLDDGQIEILDTQIIDGYIVFTTTHFSMFGIIADEDIAIDTQPLPEGVVPTDDSSLSEVYILLGCLSLLVLLMMKKRKTHFTNR